MEDLEFVKLVERLECHLDGKAALTWWPVFQLPGAALAQQILNVITANQPQTERLRQLEHLLKSELGDSSGNWNPFFAAFAHYQRLMKIQQLATALNSEDQKTILLSCKELRASIMCRLVEEIISSVGLKSIDFLASRVSELFHLKNIQTRHEMLATIERNIGRSLTASEQNRLNPILSDIGGWHHRQIS